MLNRSWRLPMVALAVGGALAACRNETTDEGHVDRVVPTLPQLAAATPATLQVCTNLIGAFTFPSTQISAVTLVSAGTLQVAGTPIAQHCRVTGTVNTRTGVNGTYQIGFEIRLPTNWNGRFFHQGNGGADGSVSTAVGIVGGGGALSNALSDGFAVLSSDAGHNGAQNGYSATNFGLDPQARLDYGYKAVGTLTPMARELVRTAYGKYPDRMYFGGCSNGGRHALVAASRYSDIYDGILAGDPGYDLPAAGMGVIWNTQQWASIATANLPSGLPDVSSGFNAAERTLVGKTILAKCDALDGATDDMVQDSKACQTAFNLDRDVPTCNGGRDGTCLTPEQKSAIKRAFSSPTNSAGTALYSAWPFDPGIAASDWSTWKFFLNPVLGAGAVPYIFMTPPVQVPGTDLLQYSIGYNWDTDASKIDASDAVFTESANSFMTPPDPSNLYRLKARGGKLVIYHGTGDGAFSLYSTEKYYNNLRAANNGDASNFARLFEVPGMSHCSNGPSTDQFDALTALVNWVEKGQAPDSIVAGARGAGNLGGVNRELPASWSATRTRPLCPYPKVARLKSGATDLESASSFSCQ
jgi:pimeloyl-ACP methyl ester carboxylesterase